MSSKTKLDYISQCKFKLQKIFSKSLLAAIDKFSEVLNRFTSIVGIMVKNDIDIKDVFIPSSGMPYIPVYFLEVIAFMADNYNIPNTIALPMSIYISQIPGLYDYQHNHKIFYQNINIKIQELDYEYKRLGSIQARKIFRCATFSDTSPIQRFANNILFDVNLLKEIDKYYLEPIIIVKKMVCLPTNKHLFLPYHVKIPDEHQKYLEQLKVNHDRNSHSIKHYLMSIEIDNKQYGILHGRSYSYNESYIIQSYTLFLENNICIAGYHDHTFFGDNTLFEKLHLRLNGELLKRIV